LEVTLDRWPQAIDGSAKFRPRTIGDDHHARWMLLRHDVAAGGLKVLASIH
jgi:hypothetical protein